MCSLHFMVQIENHEEENEFDLFYFYSFTSKSKSKSDCTFIFNSLFANGCVCIFFPFALCVKLTVDKLRSNWAAKKESTWFHLFAWADRHTVYLHLQFDPIRFAGAHNKAIVCGIHKYKFQLKFKFKFRVRFIFKLKSQVKWRRFLINKLYFVLTFSVNSNKK